MLEINYILFEVAAAYSDPPMLRQITVNSLIASCIALLLTRSLKSKIVDKHKIFTETVEITHCESYFVTFMKNLDLASGLA